MISSPELLHGEECEGCGPGDQNQAGERLDGRYKTQRPVGSDISEAERRVGYGRIIKVITKTEVRRSKQFAAFFPCRENCKPYGEDGDFQKVAEDGAEDDHPYTQLREKSKTRKKLG